MITDPKIDMDVWYYTEAAFILSATIRYIHITRDKTIYGLDDGTEHIAEELFLTQKECIRHYKIFLNSLEADYLSQLSSPKKVIANMLDTIKRTYLTGRPEYRYKYIATLEDKVKEYFDI